MIIYLIFLLIVYLLKFQKNNNNIIIHKKNQYKLEIYNFFDPNFQKISLKVGKLLNKCWNNGDFSPYPGYKWYIISNNKDIISVLALDRNNTIWYLCTDPRYRNKNYAKILIKKLMFNNCKKYNKIYAYIDKSKSNYKKINKFYKNLKFKELNVKKNIKLLYKSC